MTPHRLSAVPDELAADSPQGTTQLLLTIKETAYQMGVSESTTKKYVMSGEWPSITIGRSRRVVYLGLLRWIEGRQA